jgi:hypothetical protein
VLDISFVAGIALGMIVTGFCAIGSFDRGSDSVHRRSWNREYAGRRQAALLSSRTRLRSITERNSQGALPKAG